MGERSQCCVLKENYMKGSTRRGDNRCFDRVGAMQLHIHVLYDNLIFFVTYSIERNKPLPFALQCHQEINTFASFSTLQMRNMNKKKYDRKSKEKKKQLKKNI